ncbi:MAG TPA: pitrilysin family protein [Terriglobia bacterium]|nr:pitrilysin family protein [Terriglobia bacterium]
MTAKREFSNLLPAALLAVLVAAIPASSQAGGGQEHHNAELSKVVRLNRAPVSNEVLKVHLPRPVVTKLPNGLTVLVLEQHKLPLVNFMLWIETGALSDPKDMPGLAGFTAEMLKEGTTHRTSAQLAADVDDIGATLNAQAPFGSTHSSITASGLAPSAGQVLELMSDAVLNPTFPSDELEKYKQRQLSQLEQERSQPFSLGQEKFRQAVYQDSPASVMLPTAESIKAATPERLKEFHDRYYVPSNAILGIVGDVKQDEIMELVRKQFGDWKGAPVSKADWSHLPEPASSKIYLVDRPDSVQANILAGDYGARRADPDFPALMVMNQVLGGGPQSRLFLNLREEHGYTYGAYSRTGDDKYREAWEANTEVRNAVTDGSMEQLMAEFKRIREQQVPEGELNEARHAIVASFALSLEQPQGILNRWMIVQSEGLPMDYWDRYPVQVAEITPDAVKAAAQKYVDLAHLQIVCVADAKQPGNDQKQTIRQVLEKYGTVEVYDTNGKKED